MYETPPDVALDEVVSAILETPDVERRFARVFRETFDQLYDGQRTGRYKWDQLFKTEKTHFGTLIEINLRREFDDLIDDGVLLDYKIRGHDIDCKYSFRFGGWMLPPECLGQLLLVCTANDEDSEWSVGVVRASAENLGGGVNRDRKWQLNDNGRQSISRLFWGAELPPNVLLQIDSDDLAHITDSARSGQARVNELFRRVTNRRIGRNTVATVAKQDDYMKRVRANGGARTALASEGILIAGGDYEAHRQIARELGVVVPEPGEFVSFRVAKARVAEPFATELQGQLWRVADDSDLVDAAPELPTTKR